MTQPPRSSNGALNTFTSLTAVFPPRCARRTPGQAAIFYISVMRFDWGDEARKALHRVENSEGAAAAAAGEGGAGAGEREPLLGTSGEEAGDEEQEEKDAQEVVARVRGGHVPLHGGADTRHGVHEPTLT